MQNLPHSPGSLSRARLGNLEPNQTEDSYTSQVVGQDNLTGDVIIAESGSSRTQKATPKPDQTVVNGINVQANRDRSSNRQGIRLISAEYERPPRSVLGFRPSQTQPFATTEDNNGCPPQRVITTLNRINNDDEEPVEETPPELPPEEPDNPDEGETDEETPNPSVPNGCDSESSSQWYRAESCPSGTSLRGTYTDPNDDTWVLCEGESRPQGDGCPYEYPSLGVSYSCVNGQCVLNGLAGQFATFEECQASGCQPEDEPIPVLYSCVAGQCIVDPFGNFSSLIECQTSGCEGDEEPPEGFAVTLSGITCGVLSTPFNIPNVLTFTITTNPSLPNCENYNITLCNGTTLVQPRNTLFPLNESAPYECP